MSNIFAVCNLLKNWKKGDLPGNSTVSIVLVEFSTNKEGHITISQELADDSEIDCYINDLQKELETIRKEAKRVLSAQKEKIRASLEK